MLSSPIILKNLVALTNKTQKKKKKKKMKKERKKKKKKKLLFSRTIKFNATMCLNLIGKPKVLYLCFTSMNIS